MTFLDEDSTRPGHQREPVAGSTRTPSHRGGTEPTRAEGMEGWKKSVPGSAAKDGTADPGRSKATGSITQRPVAARRDDAKEKWPRRRTRSGLSAGLC